MRRESWHLYVHMYVLASSSLRRRSECFNQLVYPVYQVYPHRSNSDADGQLIGEWWFGYIQQMTTLPLISPFSFEIGRSGARVEGSTVPLKQLSLGQVHAEVQRTY
jgi:hypothetical protein